MKKAVASNKEKLDLLVKSSNIWTTKEIQQYFDLSYANAKKIKNKTIEKYGCFGARTKVCKQNVFRALNTTLEEQIKALKDSVEVSK